MNKPGIVFMGTPEFAVASLDAIVKAGFDIKAVITAPDKPSGRGLQLRQSPVKEYALKHDLRVLEPLKLKDPDFLLTLRAIQADLQVVVAFRMLPEEVWSMPPLGTFNLHASILPQYRGAAPINWAVINGETKTGVTTFFLNSEIDRGSIIYCREIPIGENDTAGELHDTLMNIGAELVVKTVTDISKGIVVPREQDLIYDPALLKPAPKIFKDHCRIKWDDEIKKIYNLVRGLSPYPAAWSEISDNKHEQQTVKIYSCKPVEKAHNAKPGSIDTDGKHFLRVAVSNGFLDIKTIQLQAKKQMGIEDFLRGFPDISAYHFV